VYVRHLCPRAGCAILILLLTPIAFAADARLPMPPAAAIEETEKLIGQEAFAQEYADRTINGRKHLLKVLLKAASETTDDPAIRYVLLRESMTVANTLGDFEAAFRTADAIAEHFLFDALAVKADIAQKSLPLTNASSAASLSAAGVALSDEAFNAAGAPPKLPQPPRKAE
jgi:hypothetical protein